MATTAATSFEQRIAAVRRFNRAYTRQIGVLDEHLVASPFSLTEARVLYELAHRGQTSASELGNELGLDAGYLSRILRGFQKRGLLSRRASRVDGRQMVLSLTDRGRHAFAQLDARSRDATGALLSGLSDIARERLVAAMQTIEDLLATPAGGTPPQAAVPYLLRPPQPGDMGWVVSRHGLLYAREYGWNQEFEALVAEIVAHFVRRFDPERERCWIAERSGENAGCVFLVKRSKTVAQLRLLLVDPTARGVGIGARLVHECVRFARAAGYRKVMLWTNDVLHAARRIYQAAGFRLVREERHTSFGQELVGQFWELEL